MSNISKDLKTFNHIVNALINEEKTKPVTKVILPEELFETIDLSLNATPISDEEHSSILEEIVLSTPKTATNLFFNQLFGGRQSKAVLGDLLAVMLNNSMYTYKVAGPQVGIEKEIIRKSCDLINYGKNSGGTFPTGGSMSNYMALVMARDAADPSSKSEGVTQRMIAYTSKESHYSNAKNAAFAGIGRNNVRYIVADEKGRMIPEKLEARIEEDLANGYKPFFINATAGTTVLGAFDPIEPIAEIAGKHNIWLHVDGAYCGSVLFSEKYGHLIKGVEKADSFSYNAHKMIGTPLTCSIILVKDKKHLTDSFSNDASYLYQTDGDDYNLGKTSFQCGRRNDALKFWTLWKSVGTEGLTEIVDHQFHLADVARDYVRDHPDYELYSFDNSISVCFSYKGIPADKLCTELYENEETIVGFGSFKGQQFVRFVTINANNLAEDIVNFFKVMEGFVKTQMEENFAEAIG